MSIIKRSLTKFTGTTGFELAEHTGAAHSEGVQVAIFPAEPEKATLGPKFAYAPGIYGRSLSATFPDWGTRLLDVVLDKAGKGRGVKWWKVRDYGRQEKVDWVPVSWQGAIVDIPSGLFRPEMGVRFFNSGPWFFPYEGTHLEDNLYALEQFIGNPNDPEQAYLRSVLTGDADSGAPDAVDGT